MPLITPRLPRAVSKPRCSTACCHPDTDLHERATRGRRSRARREASRISCRSARVRPLGGDESLHSRQLLIGYTAQLIVSVRYS
jgi:hypothetical protein